jgi:2-methylcitrate dehydratase PrpD
VSTVREGPARVLPADEPTTAGSRTKPPPITSMLASFVADIELEAIGPVAIAGAKRSFADAIGVAVAGSRQPGPTILTRYVSELRAKPIASVIGGKVKSTPALAAWVNGTSADALGWADFSLVQMNHPSAAIAPAMLALGEAENATGQDILLAYIAGVEVSNKLAQGVKPGFHTKGWHALGVCNTFGVAAAAARLLRFDATQTANALGLAGAQASGIKASMVTMTKSYVAGAAARDGIDSALLARRGYTGPTDVFEGRDGFLQTFGSGADGLAILAGLGDPFEFESPGLTLKLFPSCTHTHTGIVAALNVKAKYGVSPDEIDSITCSVTPVVYDFLAWPSPKDAKEAKFSMQFCVATALLNPTVKLANFADSAVNDPRTVALMERISMVISPELAALGYNPSSGPSGCIMTVRLRNGTEYVERVDKGPWEPPSVPSEITLREKFVAASEGIVDARSSSAAFDALCSIERASDVHALMALLRT